MENKEYTFTTNINCGSCIKAVTPHLEKAQGIAEWSVNTNDERKILTVISNGITPEEITEIISNAGFRIQKI